MLDPAACLQQLSFDLAGVEFGLDKGLIPFFNVVEVEIEPLSRPNSTPAEVLKAKPKHSLADFKTLQADYLSVPARRLVPLLSTLQDAAEPVEWARQQLLNWNFKLEPGSIPAAVYVAWETELRAAVYEQIVPEKARDYLGSIPLERVIEWLQPNSPGPLKGLDHNDLLLTCLENAVTDLTERLGFDRTHWWYGQSGNKHIRLFHPLSNLMTPRQAAEYAVGPVDRGGLRRNRQQYRQQPESGTRCQLPDSD